jgi:hypothetical protein
MRAQLHVSLRHGEKIRANGKMCVLCAIVNARDVRIFLGVLPLEGAWTQSKNEWFLWAGLKRKEIEIVRLLHFEGNRRQS